MARLRNNDTTKERKDVSTQEDISVWEDEGGSLVNVAPKKAAKQRTAVPIASKSSAGLPIEIVDRFTKPFGRFLKIEAASGVILLLVTCVAVVIANSEWSTNYLGFWQIQVGLGFGPFRFFRSIQQWINDGLMTLFFFVVALELKRELVLGELRGWRKAAFSFAGALGGMLLPAGIYAVLMFDRAGSHGWGVVMATDTAFVIGCLAILGPRVPPSLRLFLLSLAIFDDVGAILVVAVGYGEALVWPALTASILGISLVGVTSRLGVRSIPIYFFLGGFIWLAFDASGIHPTIAGVILGLMTPTRGWISDERLRSILDRVIAYPKGEHWSGDTSDRAHLQQAGRAAREALSPVEQLEMKLHPWAGFCVMPIFALANADIHLSGGVLLEPVSVAIIAGLVVGKPIGVIAMCALAVRLGLANRPPGLSWSVLSAGSLLTGIGFTMSLFIAGLAYSPARLDGAKVGILFGSIVSAIAGLLTLGALNRRRPSA